MSSNFCKTCLNPKANLQCGVCEGSICRNCTEFLDADIFSLMENKPFKELRFCHQCFNEKVAPEVQKYKSLLAKAKQVFILGKVRRKPLPIIRVCQTPITIEACDDKEETYLRLGFLAAEKGYNSVIKTDVTCEKVRNGGYQKMLWRGEGYAADLDGDRIEF